MPTLETVYRKLRHAEKDLDALEGELRLYDQSHPWACEWEVDPQDSSQVLRLSVLREPDPDWKIMVGEIAYQLRTSLDHLVTQLVVLNGGNSDNHRGGFPIYATERDYREKTVRSGGSKVSRRNLLLKGVSGQHRAIIDSLQPYNRGAKMARHDPLSVVNDLCNGDKHRDSHPAVLVRRESALTVESAEGGQLLFVQRRQDGALVEREPLHDGAEVFRFSFTPADGSRPSPMDMNAAITFGVCFSRRHLFLNDLRSLLSYVETKVIARFSPLFVK